jgi:uncharacterized protein (TIGR03435 family)
MVQSLLIQEFRLQVHREQKLQDAFALVVAKSGSKLRKWPGPHLSGPGCERSDANGLRHAHCDDMGMAGLAERLPELAGVDIDRTVVDQTGIAGTYDIQLDWAWNAQVANDAPSIFNALAEQLGLRLEQRKLSLPAIVIDHAERLAEN